MGCRKAPAPRTLRGAGAFLWGLGCLGGEVGGEFVFQVVELGGVQGCFGEGVGELSQVQGGVGVLVVGFEFEGAGGGVEADYSVVG